MALRGLIRHLNNLTQANSQAQGRLSTSPHLFALCGKDNLCLGWLPVDRTRALIHFCFSIKTPVPAGCRCPNLLHSDGFGRISIRHWCSPWLRFWSAARSGPPRTQTGISILLCQWSDLYAPKSEI